MVEDSVAFKAVFSHKGNPLRNHRWLKIRCPGAHFRHIIDPKMKEQELMIQQVILTLENFFYDNASGDVLSSSQT
ncbi:hypothetical protein STEG23_010859, partial [Scotinomys teguina]